MSDNPFESASWEQELRSHAAYQARQRPAYEATYLAPHQAGHPETGGQRQPCCPYCLMED
jgi:hypothetical protein